MLDKLLDKLACSALNGAKEKDNIITLRFKRTYQGTLELELVKKELKRIGATFEQLTRYSHRITIKSLPKNLISLNSIPSILNQLDTIKKTLKKKFTITDIEKTTDLLKQNRKGTNYCTIPTHSALWSQKPFIPANRRKKNFVAVFCRMQMILKHASSEEKSILNEQKLLRPKIAFREQKLKTGLGFNDPEKYGDHPFIYGALYPFKSKKSPTITSGTSRAQFFFDYEKVLTYLRTINRTSDHFKYENNAEHSPIQIGNVIRRVCFESGGVNNTSRKIYQYSHQKTGEKFNRIVHLGEENIRGDARFLLAIQMFRELENIALLDEKIVSEILAPFDKDTINEEQCEEIIINLYHQFYPLVECMIFDDLPFKYQSENLLIKYNPSITKETRVKFTRAALENKPEVLKNLLTEYPQLIESDMRELSAAHPIATIITTEDLSIKNKINLLKIFFETFSGDVDQLYAIAASNRPSADITFKIRTALMLAAELGHLKIVKYLLEKGANVHFIDEKNNCYPRINALLLAKHNGHQKIIDLLQKNNAVMIEEPVDTLPKNLVPNNEQTILEDLNTILKIISGSPCMSVSLVNNKHTKKLIFYTLINRSMHPIHRFQIPIVMQALGEHRLDNVDTRDIKDHQSLGFDEFEIMLDNQTKNNEKKLGFGNHDAFSSLLQVLERLLQKEIETILTDAQNHFYNQKNNEPHPITGKGATHPSVILKCNKLSNFQILVTIDDQYQPTIKVIAKNDIQKYKELVKASLSFTLDIANKISENETTLCLRLTVTEFLAVLYSRRINWSAIVILDENGHLLLANRVSDNLELGHTPPGGWHTSPYSHDGVVQHAKEEFNLTVAAKDYAHIPLIGRFGDQAIYLLRSEYWSVEKKYLKEGPFKAAENEFKKGTELIVPVNELFKLFLRDENAIEVYLSYEENNIKNALKEAGIDVHAVNILKSYITYYVGTPTAIIKPTRSPNLGIGTISIVAPEQEFNKIQSLSFRVKVNAEIVIKNHYCFWTFLISDPASANIGKIVQQIQNCAKNKLNFPTLCHSPEPNVSILPIEANATKNQSTSSSNTINVDSEIYRGINDQKLDPYKTTYQRIVRQGDIKSLHTYIRALNAPIGYIEFSKTLTFERLSEKNIKSTNIFMITDDSPFSFYNLVKEFVLSKDDDNFNNLFTILLDEMNPQVFPIAMKYIAKICAQSIQQISIEKFKLLLNEGCFQKFDQEVCQHFRNCVFLLAKTNKPNLTKKELLFHHVKQSAPALDISAQLTELLIEKIETIAVAEMKIIFSWGASTRLGDQQIIAIAREHNRNDLFQTILSSHKPDSTKPSIALMK